jgi:hypothetical protein|tara:strand:- start:71584 stop:71790 length:207 start_codon:yes stop_codon:yes gene_type:complete
MVVELDIHPKGIVSENHRLLTNEDLEPIGRFDGNRMEYEGVVSKTIEMGGDYFFHGAGNRILVYRLKQ